MTGILGVGGGFDTYLSPQDGPSVGRRGLQKGAYVELKELTGHILLGETRAAELWTRQALAAGMDPNTIINQGLLPGMAEVGQKFRDYEYYLPEVLVAGKAMNACLALVKPLLTGTESSNVGRVVIGTVQGDLHDIGKNLVAMMLEGAGFEVIDIGINISAEDYLAALEEHQPDILGMSALLTTTMPYMKVVIDALQEKGVRSDYVVLVGGAPLNEAFAESVGADAYCRDAATAVETAKSFMARRQGSAESRMQETAG